MGGPGIELGEKFTLEQSDSPGAGTVTPSGESTETSVEPMERWRV
jgi:hypothetical protein